MDSQVEEILGYLNMLHIYSGNEKAYRTQTAIQNVVRFISYKYLRQDEIVTISEELNHVDIFIELFKQRFGDHLEFEKKIDSEAAEFYIPNYSILEFIENSIFHGLLSKEGDWKLKLEVCSTPEDILIQVSDNGIGFDPSLLNLSAYSGKVGKISTVLKRNGEYFGKDVDIKITSACSKGTRVRLVLPKL